MVQKPVDPSSITITVRPVKDTDVSLSVKADATVGSLRTAMQEEGSPVVGQVFTFGGNTLNDAHTLKDCNVKDKDILVLVQKPGGPPTIHITVQTNVGNEYKFDVKASDTLGSLRQKIQEMETVSMNQQDIVLKGQRLINDESTLAGYNVVDGSLLHLVAKLSKSDDKSESDGKPESDDELEFDGKPKSDDKTKSSGKIEPNDNLESNGKSESTGRLESNGKTESNGNLEFNGKPESNGNLESNGRPESNGNTESDNKPKRRMVWNWKTFQKFWAIFGLLLFVGLVVFVIIRLLVRPKKAPTGKEDLEYDAVDKK